MPLNLFDAHYRSFGKLVLPELVKRRIGVLGMKSMAAGILLKSKAVTPIECLHYALNLPTSVVITGIDSMEILDQAFEAVRTFHSMSDAELQPLLAKTAAAAATGKFEPFKTTSLFHGTAPASLEMPARRIPRYGPKAAGPAKQAPAARWWIRPD